MDDASSIGAVVSALIGRRVASVERVVAGRNSRVYRMTCADGACYAVKHYVTATERGGLDVEAAAMRFLYAYGIRQTPRVIALDREQAVGVYEFVPGDPPGTDVTSGDIDAAVGFVLRLDQLNRPDVDWNLPAAEACFSLEGVVKSVEARLTRLRDVRADNALYCDLHAFLEGRLIPVFADVIEWGRGFLARNQLSMDAELGPDDRILSPSDFGFHNAIRRPDGAIVFVDLEYFGWDDPAKLVSDFLLHPAMNLEEVHKKRFTTRLCEALQGRRLLAKRLPVAYALFAIKWCTILLNEFVPEHMARRRFAGDSRAEDRILSGQLAKARAMCDRIAKTYKDFPYGD